ncbi:MAG: lovK [Phenylobacterium sp.]|nr:lovK [Phenylobacterium sp.]
MDEVEESHGADQAPDAEHAGTDPFGRVIRGTQMPIVIADASLVDQPIIFANDAFLALTGYGRDEVIGRNCRFLQGPLTDPEQVARVRRAIGAGEEINVELLNYRKDGSAFWNRLYVSPVADEAGDVIYFFGSQSDVSDTKAAELSLTRWSEGLRADVDTRTRELERALEQKTTLLHEVDHRVKNNLQLISSLLLLQSRRTEDERTRLALRSMLERVSAVATVHRRLFQSDDLEHFDVAEFLRDLTSDLAASAGRDDICIRLDLEHVAVPAAQAAPLALVANELICNALKHAFPAGREGRIEVSTRQVEDRFLMTIEDDGVGLPAGRPVGFGTTIVQLLSQQLRGRLEITDTQPGVKVVVTVPVSTPA